ncbi:MAG: prephenate dehydrogenase [Rubripirellula sp.]
MSDAAELEWPRRVTILGVGLLGGSVALAIRRVCPTATIVGFARSEAKQKTLTELGIVDQAVGSVDVACRESDVVVVAAPVDKIAEMAIQATRAAPRDCLVTDVGSTKSQIVDAVAADPEAEARFVAAHPIAGSEKSGPQHATESLFEGKVVVITPGPRTPDAQLEKARRFWQLTGGQTHEMTPAEHDTHLAAISHVPHLVSALVARLAQPEARSLVGSGWRDITRVAAGDPTLWTAICRENRAAIGQELDRFASELEQLRRLLSAADDDAIHRWLTAAKEIKEQTP